MIRSPKSYYALGGAFCLWLGAMALIYHAHYLVGIEDELGYINPDVRIIKSEELEYYNILRDGEKIGYRTESWFRRNNLIMCGEENVIKMNLAGLSREVYFQSLIAIDIETYLTRSISYSITSGSYLYLFDGKVSGDSLIIEVQNYRNAPKRKGVFEVVEEITFPSAVPFYLRSTTTETMSMMVFDPLLFSEYLVAGARIGFETHISDEKAVNLERYELIYSNHRSNMWLDSNGKLEKVDAYMVFGGHLGNFSLEKTEREDVFLLPVEVSFGNDVIQNFTLTPDRKIIDPRSTSYLKILLDGIRAANIDVTASEKEIVSVNPLVFGIHNTPVAAGQRKESEFVLAYSDTMNVGTSDYIQPKDARMIRMAREIISTSASPSMPDTLAVAQAINRWVFENVTKMEGLDIIRSIDILRERKGACDEHTKLFTALSRALGIITEIRMGLVYDENTGFFRYQSWPAVFADGAWHALDPTRGQDVADATHVTLVRGDFEKLVELLRIIGTLSIKILDYR